MNLFDKKSKFPEYYLESGNKTQAGENVELIASLIKGNSSEEIINQIMYIINSKIPMKRDNRNLKKFRRTAEEIIQDRSRNGCCDSSTLFVSLCRAKEIPAVQIISLHIPSAKKNDFSRGHFFSGCYLKEKEEWVWIDSDKEIENIKEVVLHKWDTKSNIIDKNYYVFACERDYSEFEIDGIHINSIYNMNEIQKKIFERDFKSKKIEEAEI